MESHILHVIPNSHPLWQVHANTHLALHTKLPPPLASTCKVTSLHFKPNSHPLWQVHAKSHPYTSNQTPTPSGKYMQSHILTLQTKLPPPLASTCKVTSLHFKPNSHPLWQVHAKSHPYTSNQTPTPSGKYMQSHIFLHFKPNSHPLWQVHAKSHPYTSNQTPTPSGKYMQSHILTLQTKLPPPLASTCKVTSLHFKPNSHPLWQVHAKSHPYTSNQTPTPSGKYMQSHILTLQTKLPPPLASTCKVTSLHFKPNSHPLWQVHAKSHPYTSNQTPTPSGKYMQSHILTLQTKLPPPLASTCKVTSLHFIPNSHPLSAKSHPYTSYQTPTPSGKYMQTSHPYTSYQTPTPSGKYMQSHILTLQTKLPPPLASTCKVTSLHFKPNSHPLWQVHAKSHPYTSNQTPTPSGKYMQSHILTLQTKLPPPLASTCKVTSLHFKPNSHPLWQVHAKSHPYTSNQTPTPSGKYMQSHILTLQTKLPPPLASTCKVTSLALQTKLPPPLASTCKVTSLHFKPNSHPLWQVHAKSHPYTSNQTPTPSGKYMQSHILTLQTKLPPPLASTCKVTSLHFKPNSHPLWQVHAKSHPYTSNQTPTPSGKYMQSHILTLQTKLPPPLASTCKVTSLHFKPNSHPLWQVHAKSHPYTSNQTPTPSGKYMQSHILTLQTKLPPPLASTCKVTSLHFKPNSHPLWQVHAKSHPYTSNQTPTPSGKYMQSHILTLQTKLPPPLASTCKVTSLHFKPNSHPLWQVHAKSHPYTSNQTPTPSGKYMQSHILTLQTKLPPPLASTCKVTSLHFIPNSHPLWQVHAKSHPYTSNQTPTPSGKYMQSHILTLQTKLPPPLASTCKVTSLHFKPNSHPLWQVHAKSHPYTSNQTPTPSGKYMQSHILTLQTKLPPPLASTCKVTSLHFKPNSHPLWQVHAKSHPYTSNQTPTPSGKYMQSHILTLQTKLPPPLASTCKVTSLHFKPNSHPLWQVHAKSHPYTSGK